MAGIAASLSRQLEQPGQPLGPRGVTINLRSLDVARPERRRQVPEEDNCRARLLLTPCYVVHRGTVEVAVGLGRLDRDIGVRLRERRPQVARPEICDGREIGHPY